MAPQNVCQKFTFVKVLNVVCGKMARNGLKMANSQHCDLLRYPVFRLASRNLIFWQGMQAENTLSLLTTQFVVCKEGTLR